MGRREYEMREHNEGTRDYIIEMLAELCAMAQKDHQDDILPFLNLSYLAITSQKSEGKPPVS